jgi:hypothetical protein
MTITRRAVVSQEGMALRHAHDDYKKNLWRSDLEVVQVTVSQSGMTLRLSSATLS